MAAIVEACVDTWASALAAARAGAARLEVCAALHDGGTTPSAGLVAAIRAYVGIPVFAIVRPRGGDFVYTPGELDVMRRDIDALRSAGADGIVTGLLTRDNHIDAPRLNQLVAWASGWPVTFHRAFDLTTDLGASLEILVDAGVHRVLTSGGCQTAALGTNAIADLVRRARSRIVVVAGGSIHEDDVGVLVARTGVTEVHVRASRVAVSDARPPAIRLRKALPSDERAWDETDEARIRAIVAAAGTRRD